MDAVRVQLSAGINVDEVGGIRAKYDRFECESGVLLDNKHQVVDVLTNGVLRPVNVGGDHFDVTRSVEYARMERNVVICPLWSVDGARFRLIALRLGLLLRHRFRSRHANASDITLQHQPPQRAVRLQKQAFHPAQYIPLEGRSPIHRHILNPQHQAHIEQPNIVAHNLSVE
jgi:hypothetical protein